MVCRNHSRLRHRLIAWRSAVCNQNHMRPVNFLCVKPPVALKRRFHTEQIILQVVLSRPNRKSIARAVLIRMERAGFCFLLRCRLDRIPVCISSSLSSARSASFSASSSAASTLSRYPFLIALFYLLCQHLLCCLGFLIQLKILLRILLRGQTHIQRNLHLRTVRAHSNQ